MRYNKLGLISIVFLMLFVIGLHSAEEKINVSKELTNLKSSNRTKKLEAIHLLGRSKDKRAISELARQLKNEKSPQVKTAIVESFSYSHDAETIRETVNLLNTEKDYDVRYACVYSLGYAKDPSVVPVLIRIFLDENEPLGVRLQAANALTNYPATEEIFQCFMTGLENKDVNIVTQSIVSLTLTFGGKSPERVVPVLKKFVSSENEKVSKTAKDYLEFLGVK